MSAERAWGELEREVAYGWRQRELVQMLIELAGARGWPVGVLSAPGRGSRHD
jgi:hypothetical protein